MLRQSNRFAPNHPTEGFDDGRVFWLFAAEPISFRMEFVPIVGGVLPALMLSYAITLQGQSEDGWFSLTSKEWSQVTGISQDEQASARRKLRESGCWDERLSGLPARLYYHVNITELINRLPKGER